MDVWTCQEGRFERRLIVGTAGAYSPTAPLATRQAWAGSLNASYARLLKVTGRYRWSRHDFSMATFA